MKKILPFIILVIVVIVAVSVFAKIRTASIPPVTNYEECVKGGNIILDSYPPQCKTSDGKSFTQDIGNELEKKDLITIDNPRPNQRIKSPLTITGKARGTWFFEASFPVKLLDGNGEVIAESHVQAQGEWMTEDFVPYEAVLEFETTLKEGKLILEKDNPSGLPENADQLEIPVKF